MSDFDLDEDALAQLDAVQEDFNQSCVAQADADAVLGEEVDVKPDLQEEQEQEKEEDDEPVVSGQKREAEESAAIGERRTRKQASQD